VNDILGQRSYTTTVGIDGSYVVIKQLALDTVAVAAVAVEGLVPPKETRYWEKPQHIVNIFPVPHNSENARLCRGIMFSYELPILTRLNDKGLLSTVLKAGEVVGPVPLTRDRDRWHISGVPAEYVSLRDRITDAIGDLCVLYFKPSPGHPALRLEICKEAAL